MFTSPVSGEPRKKICFTSFLFSVLPTMLNVTKSICHNQHYQNVENIVRLKCSADEAFPHPKITWKQYDEVVYSQNCGSQMCTITESVTPTEYQGAIVQSSLTIIPEKVNRGLYSCETQGMTSNLLKHMLILYQGKSEVFFLKILCNTMSF